MTIESHPDIPSPANLPSCPRAEDAESRRTEATFLSDSQPSSPYSPDPRTPPGTMSTHAFLGSWAPVLCSSQSRLPLRASPPPSHSSRVTSRVTLASLRGGDSLGASARRGQGLAEPGGDGCHLRATPPARATETRPYAVSQSQSGLRDQFWPRPQPERGGEELPHLLAVPWLASGGTRPLQQGV